LFSLRGCPPGRSAYCYFQPPDFATNVAVQFAVPRPGSFIQDIAIGRGAPSSTQNCNFHFPSSFLARNTHIMSSRSAAEGLAFRRFSSKKVTCARIRRVSRSSATSNIATDFTPLNVLANSVVCCTTLLSPPCAESLPALRASVVSQSASFSTTPVCTFVRNWMTLSEAGVSVSTANAKDDAAMIIVVAARARSRTASGVASAFVPIASPFE
jgi:hypothetical protein